MEAVHVGRWLPLLACIILVTSFVDVNADYSKVRSKRDLMELGNLIGSVTGKSLYSVYTSYNGYGCFCGVGGKGKAVDSVDRCCQQHDRCFGAAQRGVCSNAKASVYNQSYKYSTKATKSHSNGIYATVKCNPLSSYSDMAQGLCARALCSCDSVLATCFARHQYNSKYAGYDRTKCK